MTDTLPLSGIQVVALEHAIAAPLCTRQLAELGARVIKIERPGTGDFARHYDSRVKGLCSHFVWTNRSKESLSLDLKKPQAGQIVQRLLANSDVLVQNLAPSAATRLGLDFKSLHDSNPQLIVCNISGYGSDGPYASRKAYDLLIQAEAGFLSVTGTPDTMVKSGISIADIAAGTQAHAAVLAALIQRSKTGSGSEINISLLESMVEWMGFPLNYAYDGADPPERHGADHASIYPYGVFSTDQGDRILLGLQNEREWAIFCHDVLEQPELIQDPRLCSNSQRSGNRELLKAIIEDRLQQLGPGVLADRLDNTGIAYANVNDLASVWNHPQLAALDKLVEFDTPEGTVVGFLPPGKNNSFQHSIGPLPELGEHSESILAELGYDSGTIATLANEGVI